MDIQTPLADAHIAAGATLIPCFGVGLPDRFTGPSDEYRHAREHAALLDTNFRAVFTLSGPDRARYLNAVLTSNVRDIVPGQGCIGLLLNAQGHIQAEIEALAREEDILILAHASVREKTFATLDKFIIMDDATLTDETAASATLAIEGPAAPTIVRELTGVELDTLALYGHLPVHINTASGAIPCRIIRHSLFGFTGAEFLCARDHIHAVWTAAAGAVQAHGGVRIGCRTWNALRLEAGIPWFGADFDEHRIPHEAALEHTHISFTKGCYTGQEIVERVRSRGHVNRRRTGLIFSASDPPEPGAPVTGAGAPTDTATGADAGHVTSAAFSPRAGKPIGMAYLRREHTQPGTVLQCDNSEAHVIELPLA